MFTRPIVCQTPTEIDDLGDKRRPQILYDIVEKVKAYYDDPDVMPVLQIANADKRASDRQRRSESRERIISLLTAMIMCMDLAAIQSISSHPLKSIC